MEVGEEDERKSSVLRAERPAHLPEEGAIELDDVGTIAAPHHHLQVHQELLLLLLVHRGPNPLKDKRGSHVQFLLAGGRSLEVRPHPQKHRRPPPNHLNRHNLVTGLVHHLVDGAIRPAADLAQIFEVLGGEVPVLLQDLQLSRRLDAVRSQPFSNRKRVRRRYGGRSSGAARGGTTTGLLTCAGSGRAAPPCSA